MNINLPALLAKREGSKMDPLLRKKIVLLAFAAVLSLFIAVAIGGVYTITPPSGPVDAAYKINRFTGNVWLIKTYAKPMAQGQVRVLVAREARVEKTLDLSDDALRAFAVNQPATVATPVRRR
jgi:hypothetical protein